jgi:hypothetical protein
MNTTHERPTPGDFYCNNCGLAEEYWDKVPKCPATDEEVPDGLGDPE